jgi:hypothetical protein
MQDKITTQKPVNKSFENVSSSKYVEKSAKKLR